MNGSAPIKQSNEGGKLLDELRLLREENDRLKALLSRHGIAWQEDIPAKVEVEIQPQLSDTTVPMSTPDKVALFRWLFRGREDVYPIRWESAKGTSGYVPACGNEWKPGVFKKPRIKCTDCEQRLLMPVTD